ncbi:hypothetical protein AURDEDRAFT_99661, partial [Auricularia subglabra TFB-10046 SS5]
PDSDDDVRRSQLIAPRSQVQITWRDVASSTFRPTLELENVGSVARDHLASERTWLAYIRTSLALASTGVALVQLFTVAARESNAAARLQCLAQPLGAVIVALGLCVLAIGFWRFFHIQHALTKGKFPAARLVVTLLSSLLALLIAVVFVALTGVSR